MREASNTIDRMSVELIDDRKQLADKRQRLDVARKRELAGQAVGALPGGSMIGGISTAMSVEAALAIARLEPEILALESRIPSLEQDIRIQQRNQSRFEANLSNLSGEANQLACVI